jgi:uncharacterized protein (DUF488 family)
MKRIDADLSENDQREALLTIGYGSQRSFDDFVTLLLSHGVNYLVDVRTKPFSKFRPEFSQEPLAANLRRSKITYVSLGETLGGRPSDPTCYTNGKVDYLKVRERDWFAEGLMRLETGWHAGHRIAIMCAELAPERCHRTKLVGEALVARGVLVGHLDESGAVISHEAVMARLQQGQAPLFD